MNDESLFYFNSSRTLIVLVVKTKHEGVESGANDVDVMISRSWSETKGTRRINPVHRYLLKDPQELC